MVEKKTETTKTKAPVKPAKKVTKAAKIIVKKKKVEAPKRTGGLGSSSVNKTIGS